MLPCSVHLFPIWQAVNDLTVSARLNKSPWRAHLVFFSSLFFTVERLFITLYTFHKFSINMSGWDAWLPQITGVGFAGGLLLRDDNVFLAATPGYQPTQAEIANICGKFKKGNWNDGTGVSFAGQKYMALRCDTEFAEFKMGTKGASAFHTPNGTIAVCFYNESSAVNNPAAAGGAASRVQKVFADNGL